MAGDGLGPGIIYRAIAAFLRRLSVIFPVLLLAAGCARLVPGPPPLVGEERALVLSRYHEYLQRSPLCAGIDADVSIQYQSILKDARIPGVLLAKSPASLKVMGLSPLGQPLLVFTLHDSRFILIDVHGQNGYTGSITAQKVRNLLPLEKLAEAGLYALLTGAPAIPVEDQLVVSRLPEDGEGLYLLSWPQGEPHRQEVFNLTAGQVEAFRLLDAANRVLLEIRYSPEREGRCKVPAAITISGSKVRGTVECTFEKVFPANSLADKEFTISVPDNFKMEEIR